MIEYFKLGIDEYDTYINIDVIKEVPLTDWHHV